MTLEEEQRLRELDFYAESLLICLRNLYNDYAAYYPSAIFNSPAMAAAWEFLKDEEGNYDETGAD